MDNNSLEEIIFRYRFYLLIVLLGIILIGFGFVAATKQLPFFGQDKVEILSADDGGNMGNQGNMVVEVSGAVEKPGVYTFEGGKRVEDALVLAGGLSAKADREWVDRTLNRAAKLTDGQKIFIPNEGKRGIREDKGMEEIGEIEGMVDINTASQTELESLPGVGPVTAKKIIEGRPYPGVEELLTRKILSKKLFEDLKSRLSVY